jgi:hypothetical protein
VRRVPPIISVSYRPKSQIAGLLDCFCFSKEGQSLYGVSEILGVSILAIVNWIRQLVRTKSWYTLARCVHCSLGVCYPIIWRVEWGYSFRVHNRLIGPEYGVLGKGWVLVAAQAPRGLLQWPNTSPLVCRFVAFLLSMYWMISRVFQDELCLVISRGTWDG